MNYDTSGPMDAERTATLVKFLSSIAGGKARLWSYTLTHSNLILEVDAGDGPSYIAFTGCARVESNAFWCVNSLLYQVVGRDPWRYRVVDASAQFCVEFAAAFPVSDPAVWLGGR
jgi:hypothetical protein